ncbi:MAG: BatA domain-containing protein [Planctomycetales bacterium]|nr:BatA domain-containing protein [Planctomycetales bacterium]
MSFSPVLALGFATPWLLWGLAAASVPVIIHLLHRRRYRETDWAAMRFLLAAIRKDSRRLRIEQLVLLAVRTLLIILLVLALAQPILDGLLALPLVDQPVHRVFVLDGSLSMSHQPAETSLFDRAKQIARDMVAASKPGDVFQVVRLTAIGPQVIVKSPSFQSAAVAEEISRLVPTDARGDALATLRQIDELLGLAADVKRKEIHIVSDFQRSSWAGDTDAEQAALRSTLLHLADRADLHLIDVGSAVAPNAAVTQIGLAAGEPFVSVARPARIQVGLRNFSSTRADQRTIELLVDGRVREQRSVTLPPDADVVESFRVDFSSGGEHRVQVRLDDDSLAADNSRWLVLPVRERLHVLCVNGHTGDGPFGRATDFLEIALAPSHVATRAAESLIEPQIIAEADLPNIDLSRFDCVFVCDVGLVTEREAEQLDAYVKLGGGVVWCLGENVQPDVYNRVLFRDGQGLLPARLVARKTSDDETPQPFGFDPLDYQHDLVKPFRGNPNTGLLTARTINYMRAELAANSTARVALAFAASDPAIVTQPVGRGQSVLVTTTVDPRWGNWPISPSFVPVVQELVLFASAGRFSERQRLVGEPLSQAYPTGGADVEVMVTRPDGQSQPGKMFSVTGTAQSQFTYDATDRAGVYSVQLGHPLGRSELFAVNPDPRESDLDKLTRDDLAKGLFAGIDFNYRAGGDAASPTGAKPYSSTNRNATLSLGLLFAALYLLFVEQMMAWNFRYGLLLLCPPLWLVPFFQRMTRTRNP